MLACLAGSIWGMEAGVLRTTGKSFLVSLARFGSTLVGSGAYARTARLLDTRLINIAAQRITGVGTSARRPILNMMAGLTSAPNLFTQQCGLKIDRDLREVACSMNNELGEWICRMYGIKTFSPEMTDIGERED